MVENNDQGRGFIGKSVNNGFCCVFGPANVFAWWKMIIRGDNLQVNESIMVFCCVFQPANA